MLTPRQTLIALASKHTGDWNAMLEDIRKHNFEGLEDYDRDERAITMLDEEYPEYLKKVCSRAPLVLFYKGDHKLLSATNSIAVLGSRNPSGEADMFTYDFVCKNIPQDRAIVTNLALGIGATVALAALESGHKVIAVLGSGVDCYYPASNKDLQKRIIAEGGLVISEYPFATVPSSEYFLMRNRIIAALAEKVCLMELQQHSGILTIVADALAQGKEIYAKPNLNSAEDVNNHLINEGAYCLTPATAF